LFLQAGVDPNWKEYGKLLQYDFHRELHGAGLSGWEEGGPWNYQWFRWFRENPTAKKADVDGFLKILRSIIEEKVPVDEMDWIYRPL
jgi:hypothetical protein